MDDVMRDLGRRAIAAGWRWMPGCADHLGRRVVTRDRHHGFPFAWDIDKPGLTVELGLPDFSDPATLGCLDAQLAERFGCPVVVTPFGKMFRAWRMLPPDVDEFYYRLCAIRTATTPAGAKVAALEAAPKVAP